LDTVRIVETDQPPTIRSVQRERVRESVRSVPPCLDTPDLELDPVALFEMVDTPVEGQQKLKLMFG